MQTYKKVVEMPKLVINYDDCGYSPREDDNLGYFITAEGRYTSPDGRKNKWVQDIVEQTAEEASGGFEHINLIRKAMKEAGEPVIYIRPVYRYEHGNVAYRQGVAIGFDYSNCGFYIVTKKTADVLGTPKERFSDVIDGELDTYTKYANGKIYCFRLYDDAGEVEDSCGGFYDINDIKEYLPAEYKDEDLTDYLKY